jgi:hypothetical protein
MVVAQVISMRLHIDVFVCAAANTTFGTTFRCRCGCSGIRILHRGGRAQLRQYIRFSRFYVDGKLRCSGTFQLCPDELS